MDALGELAWTLAESPRRGRSHPGDLAEPTARSGGAGAQCVARAVGIARDRVLLALKRLPPELASIVTDFAVDASSVDRFVCRCPGAAPSLTWRRPGVVVDHASYASCATCGACRFFEDAVASVSTAAVEWDSRNPHFSRRFGQSHVALRHPQSVWHNFRAVLADEWVGQGRVMYEISVLRVTQGACAIGVVGDAAAVNAVNHWVPGGELETTALVSGALAVPVGLSRAPC